MGIKAKILHILHRGPYTVEDLKKAGVTVGSDVYIGTRRIDLSHGFLLSIGNQVTLSDCRILTHDASTKRGIGFSRIGRIIIGNNVFIGADAIILPNVSIGSNVIVGAGAVVASDIPDNSVAIGCPAKIISSYESYIQKNKKMIQDGAPVYHTYSDDKTQEEIRKIQDDLGNGGIGFDV